jgi:putative inorganic carbon (hco3(-)) transporter
LIARGLVRPRHRGRDEWAGRTFAAALGAMATAVAVGLASSVSAKTAVALAVIPIVTFFAWRVQPAVFFAIGLGLMIFSSHWSLLGFPIGADRLLVGPGFAALLLRMAMGEVVSPVTLCPRHFFLGLALGYAVVSAAVSGTLTHSHSFYELLDQFGVVPFALFAAAPVAFATSRARNVLLVVLVCLGAYLGITAVCEFIGLRSLVFPRYILSAQEGLALHLGRARGPFVESVANGLALYACGVAAAIAYVSWRRGRLFAAGVIVVCALGVMFTLTRSIWLASAVATALTLVVAPTLRRYAIPAGAAIAVVLVAALLVVPGFAARATAREQDQRPIWDRLNTNAAATNMFVHRPVFGFGWSRFEAASPTYFEVVTSRPLTGIGIGVHNVFLRNLAELGLVGTLLWLLGGITAFRAAISRESVRTNTWAIGFLAVLAHWLIVANFAPMQYALANALLWTWAGVAIAAGQSRAGGGAGREAHRP